MKGPWDFRFSAFLLIFCLKMNTFIAKYWTDTDLTLNCRSGVLCEKEDSEAQAQQSKRLLDDALALLKNKSRNDNKVTTGFEFHIKDTETQLKVRILLNQINFCFCCCCCCCWGGGGDGWGLILKHYFCKF